MASNVESARAEIIMPYSRNISLRRNGHSVVVNGEFVITNRYAKGGKRITIVCGKETPLLFEKDLDNQEPMPGNDGKLGHRTFELTSGNYSRVLIGRNYRVTFAEHRKGSEIITFKLESAKSIRSEYSTDAGRAESRIAPGSQILNEFSAQQAS